MARRDIEIGLLFSRSGVYAPISRAGRAGALRAIAAVNADPDLDIRLSPVERDPQGNVDLYGPLCTEILRGTGARHVIGTTTSWSRKEVIPALERAGGTLWYPCPYEGYEASDRVVYTHACPNQHLIPLFDWVLPRHGARASLVSSNYIWGWEMSRIAHDLIAEAGGTEKVRVLFTMATYEEIGRLGSRVMAGELKPDALIGVDVNHDYVAAPGMGDKRLAPLEMGKGFTMSVGSIASEQLNRVIESTAKEYDIPMQRDMVGADTGTDGMAGVLASVDCAATSVGFPIRNMHTISETANTGDVLAAIHALTHTIQSLDALADPHREFLDNHPRLDQASPLGHQGSAKPENGSDS